VILCCLLAVAGLSKAAPQELINQPQAVELKDDQACDYCKQLVDKVLNKDTLHAVLQKVEKYCDYLPGEFGQQCKQLVEQYGEQIINEILSKYNSKTICTDIVHVCQAKKVFLVAGVQPVSASLKQEDPCAMCKQVVGQFLNKNTLEQILHKIESLCDKLPGGFATQCKQIVDQYGEQLINQILQTYTPEKVCKDIFHVCSFNKEDVARHVMPMLILANRPQYHSSGKNQLCDTCTSVATQILNKDTLDALLERAEQLCDRMPGWVGQQCHEILESEGHKVINDLLTKYTPEKVCKDLLHFC